jgi:3-oxoacyl-[acyl-carrier protein] reductase
VARDAARLQAAVEALRGEGLRAEALPFDLADEAAVRGAVDQVMERHGRIDHLINNAGIARDGLLLRMKTADWKAVLDTNLNGMFYLTRGALPAMVKARYGRIVNLTSVVAQSGNPGQTNYCASKAGIIGFTRARRCARRCRPASRSPDWACRRMWRGECASWSAKTRPTSPGRC